MKTNNKKHTRLDLKLKQILKKYSRTKIKKIIKNKLIKINNIITTKPSKKIYGNEIIKIKKKKKYTEKIKIKLNIIYKDKDILIINKKKPLLIQPNNNNNNKTIFNALINHNKKLSSLPNAGIINRLDKETTGLILVAKNIYSYNKLKKLMKKKKIKKEYEAITIGITKKKGKINLPIFRNKIKRTKMTINSNGKFALTYFSVIKYFKEYTKLRIKIITGRTHQIRLHMSHINHPIIGDKKYFNKNKKKYEHLKKYIKRHALHSKKISFNHPKTNKKITFISKIPKDMKKLTKYLKSL